MAARKGSGTDLIVSLVVFVGVLVVYVLTLCPTVYPGQMNLSLGAVVTATRTDLVRLVNYPVWRFVARLFMAISPNKAWALNLFSAVCGAAAIALLYRTFARFGHTRTREELTRYRGQPNLARFAAAAAALLVAFSHTFWRASVTAGTETLNALMLVFVTFCLVRYRETRKKRFFMLAGIVYAVGLANFPTMLLLLPVYLVLSIMWCRDAYADLITLVLTIVVGGALFAVAAISGPAGFAGAHGAEYFQQPIPVTRPMFDYVSWYWSEMRAALPVGGILGGLGWLLWLVLPTLPPVLYLAFNKPMKETGIGRASSISDNILKFLGFLYTLVGLMALFDFVLGPYGMQHHERFLVAYMVLGGWVCYMLGYWAVLFTSRPAATAEGRRTYSRPAYTALVVIMFALPAASLVKHLEADKANLSGYTLLEDFAQDAMTCAASTEADAVLVVDDDWGSLLRYVQKYRVPPEKASKVQIVDIARAESLDPIYLNKHDYMRTVLVGQKVPASQDPALDPELSDAEALLRYIILGARLSSEPQPKEVFFTSDGDRFRPENERIVFSYDLVPQGLLYQLMVRFSADERPESFVETGLDLWSKLRLANLEAAPIRSRPAGTATFLLRASKLANDFGVFCQKYADEATAVRFYRRALDFYEQNYSAIRNLQIVAAERGKPLEDEEELKLSFNEATLQVNNEVTQRVKNLLGPGASDEEQERVRKCLKPWRIMAGFGLVRDRQLPTEFLQNNIQPQLARTYEYGFSILCLVIQIDPKPGDVLIQRGQLTLTARQNAQAPELVRALEDLLEGTRLVEADPETQDNKLAEAYVWIGRAQDRLGNAEAAEAAYDHALELKPDDVASKMLLAALYSRTDRIDKAMEIFRQHLEDDPPSTDEELRRQLRLAEGFYASAEDPDGLAAFAHDYAAAHPDMGLDALLYVVDRALSQQNDEDSVDRARTLLDELETTYSGDDRVAVRRAQLLVIDKRYDEVLAIEPDAEKLSDAEHVNSLTVRGTAYLQTGQPGKALESFETAYNLTETAIRKMIAEREAQVGDNTGQINAIRREAARELQTRRAVFAPQLTRAALYAWQAERTPELAEKAEQYALLYRGLAGSASPNARMVADADYGWVLYRVKGEIASSWPRIKVAYLGMPNAAGIKVYYGALLIARGDYKAGVAALQHSLDMGLDDVYLKPIADELLAEYGAHGGAEAAGSDAAEDEGAGDAAPDNGTEDGGSGDDDTPDAE